MKAFNNYDEARQNANYVASEKLPVGAYVVGIINVQYINGENGNSDRIAIEFDISEGEYAAFFTEQYNKNPNEDKKYKGKTTIYIPKDDGSEMDGWTKNTFAKWTKAFEESNNGYIWDWDESKWVNKSIGLVFGETGNVINGKEVKYTEVRFPISVQTVRDGKAPEAKFIKKNGYTGSSVDSSNNSFVDVPNTDKEEIPF